MNTSISKEVIDTDRLADVLSMYSKCKSLLIKMNQYVSGEDEYIQQFPDIIKNSMPTEKEKQDAGFLLKELGDAERILLDWYDKFYKDKNLNNIMDNSDLIHSGYFYLRKNLLGLNKTITFKIKEGKRAGERVTYDHDKVVELNIKHLEDQVSWKPESGYYNNTSHLPDWVRLQS